MLSHPKKVTRVCICKSFKQRRNRFPSWRIDSSKSIPGLHKLLQIQGQEEGEGGAQTDICNFEDAEFFVLCPFSSCDPIEKGMSEIGQQCQGYRTS
jgi:hypothetical protein